MTAGKRPARQLGVLNLVQGAVYAFLAVQAAARWWPLGALWAAVAVAQVAAGVWWLAGRGARPARVAAIVSLAVVALTVGLYLQVGVYVVRHFHPVGAAQGWQLMGGLLLALPWVVVVPIGQLIALRGAFGARGVAAVLVLVVAPGAIEQATGGPDQVYRPIHGEAAAGWLYRDATGASAPGVPDGPSPVWLIGSVLRRGAVVTSQVSQADSLPAALTALDLPVRSGDAVLLESVVASGSLARPPLVPRSVVFVRPGETALAGGASAIGAVQTWHGRTTRGEVLPSLWLPALAPGDHTRWVRTQGWLATERGVVPLERTWAGPPALTADTALEAALAAARHIAANQTALGRYAYVVEGPSGRHGGGYNFPRHAGATWFLARVAMRTGDPEVALAARRGVGFLRHHTAAFPDGRAYVLDPARKDGKGWVGTTALALLAAVALGADADLQRGWTALVASAVDARGEVRGDFDLATGAWPEQPAVTYAQGQGLLALAAAARADVPGAAEPMARAAAYVDDRYWPMPASRLHMLDEHWMCLAMLAVHDVTGDPAGAAVCDAYLGVSAPQFPVDGQAVPLPAGAAGGLAEAVVARAELDRRLGVASPWQGPALAFARQFLAQQYRAADEPLLRRPESLVGGFRDQPWALDVRVDAVQHIGCALLGVEQILRDQPIAGAMP